MCGHGHVGRGRTRTVPGMTVGLVGAGHMGSGLGWALREGGARVVTTLDGRSPRTARLAAAAGLEVLPTLTDLLREADVVLVVTPPGAARAAAADLATAARHAGVSPVVADLNAIAPATVERIAATVAPLDLVDGSISGPPPTVRPGARLYLSGPRAAVVADLPWRHVTPIVVDDRLGSASAVKMCTASVYKGLTGLYAQALRTAGHHRVLDHVVGDLHDGGLDPVPAVAVAATKAARYVPEMLEIAATQAGAGLPAALFEAYAQIWGSIARGSLAASDPETVDRALPADVVVRGISSPAT
jgi:3-hydroxyisobutyrate dehydrogenase-like beta-hydroxyacid dehydrogenase